MGFNDPQRKMIHGKPKWEVVMEMRALRQRFDITDKQCRELIAEMQVIAKDRSVGQKYQIAAFNAIVSAMGLDQRSAIALMKYQKELIDGVPDEELDGVIDGRLAGLAPSSEAPSSSADQRPASGEESAHADNADDPPEGLS